MSAPSSPTLTPAVGAATDRDLPVAALDHSCRWPVVVLSVAALAWLVFGLALLLVTSIKLHGPGFLSGAAWLTLGRVRPAAMNAILYGFACQAAFAIVPWLIVRLGRVRLENPVGMIIAGVVWNCAVGLGVLGILGGASTGFQWMEMPRFVSPVLFACYAAIGAFTLITFSRRREPLYVSQWYLLAALFWFPWVFSAANLLLHFFPVRGVMQAAVNAWYRGNLLEMWLTPVGLAAIFYFIPKLAGRPLHSRGLATLGFWTLVFAAGWTGFTQLIGGPLPAWMISASIGANLLLLVPILCATMNWVATLCSQRDCRADCADPTMRYILVGAACYVISSLEGLVLGTRSIAEVTRFTYVETARTFLTVFGFFGMTVLGALHYMLPRVTQAAGLSAKQVRLHFLCSAGGISVVFLALTAAGLVQGIKLHNPTVPMVDVIKATIPFMGISTLGWLILLAGQVVLLSGLASIAVRLCRPACQAVLGVLKDDGRAQAEVKA
jgi:cytochrome c oxidase cbb3-type subunit I